ncbi:MAG: hypothetical protein Q8N46_09685 [Anaerolineales bacterium]|nr:hypothetical protein [Anaerolineales bacterium]
MMFSSSRAIRLLFFISLLATSCTGTEPAPILTATPITLTPTKCTAHSNSYPHSYDCSPLSGSGGGVIAFTAISASNERSSEANLMNADGSALQTLLPFIM